MSKLLVIENCNFKDYPTGGTLTFAKQLITELPFEKIALVGITTENVRIAEWTTIEIENRTIEFFPILRLDSSIKKPLIPLRIKSFFALLLYLRKIRAREYRYVFTQTPQFIFALSFFHWISICFCFAGLGNSVKLSRYKYLQFLGGFYETLLLILLNKKADCILAAADSRSINEFKQKHKFFLKKEITSFPTRYDEKIFYPRDKNLLREKLRLPGNKTILVTSGRLCWVKGWELILDVMLLRANENNTLLIFVGDGEDRQRIETRYLDLYKKDFLISGFVSQETVAEYINASDVFILGSYTEGWSTSLIEALACGKPIVTTNVSSACDIVKVGINGFIVEERDPKKFNMYINEASNLKDVSSISEQMALKYAKASLYSDFTDNWQTIKAIFK